MATGDYVTVAQACDWMGIGDSYDDVALAAAITEASREVDRICGRRFYADTVATAMKFAGAECERLYLPPPFDISSTTGLVIKTDENADGTAEVTWSASDYYLANPIGPTGEAWPYEWVERRPTSSRFWPEWTYGVEITALWGWPGAVPAVVQTATMLLAHEALKLQSAPFGAFGFGDLGVLRVTTNPRVAQMLAPYRKLVAAIA